MNSDDTPDSEFDSIEDIEASQDQEHEDQEHAEEPVDREVDGHKVLEALMAENAEMKDRLLRTVADMENLRKRTEREISDGRTYAIANFARDMLSATDNLNRALMTLSQEARDTADSSMKSLIDGIEMTEREMQRLLQKNGVKPILAEGEKFDPHQHQAMFEVPNTEVPEGTVVQVMQAGFALGDRVLRPAMVGVAKGGPKAAAQPEAAPEIDNGDQVAPDSVHIDKEA